jgi:subtilisin-like proprotein convertase family protein
VAVDGALLDTVGPNGTWSLRVADLAAWDLGTLTGWTLRFACQ